MAQECTLLHNLETILGVSQQNDLGMKGYERYILAIHTEFVYATDQKFLPLLDSSNIEFTNLRSSAVWFADDSPILTAAAFWCD